MKKILYLTVALLSILSFTSCQEEEGFEVLAKGEYFTERETTLDNLPPMFPFAPFYEDVWVNIKATGENMVRVELPATSFRHEGMDMVVPALTIPHVIVISDGEGGVKTYGDHEFNISTPRADVSGVLTFDVDEYGYLEMEVIYRYGNMPYDIRQYYESYEDL